VEQSLLVAGSIALDTLEGPYGRVEGELREGRLGPLEDGHAAGQVERLLRVQPGHAGVVVVDRAEAALGLALLVVLKALVHLEHRERPVDRPVVGRGQLGIGVATVNFHVRSIYSKLGVTSRAAATRYALELHLL